MYIILYNFISKGFNEILREKHLAAITQCGGTLGQRGRKSDRFYIHQDPDSKNNLHSMLYHVLHDEPLFSLNQLV